MVDTEADSVNMDINIVEQIRRFNRFYSGVIDVYDFYSIHPVLSDIECRILYEIAEHSDVNARELIDIIHVDRGYLSRVLSRLERDNYIIRTESAHDRRVKNLYMTDKGMEALRLCIDKANRNTKEQFGSLSEEALAKVVGAMNTIEEAFEAVNEK